MRRLRFYLRFCPIFSGVTSRLDSWWRQFNCLLGHPHLPRRFELRRRMAPNGGDQRRDASWKRPLNAPRYCSCARIATRHDKEAAHIAPVSLPDGVVGGHSSFVVVDL